MGSQHVAVLAFPFSCHSTILFNLVQKLAAEAPNVQFSFFNLAKSNNSILSSAHSIPSNIKTYNLESCDQSSSFFFKQLFENFKSSLDLQIMKSGKKITYFIADSFFSSVVCEVAQNMNIPWISVWVSSPSHLPVFFNIDYITQLYTTNKAEGHQPEDLIIKDLVPDLSPINYLDLSLNELIEPDHPLYDSKPELCLLFLSMVKTTHNASALVLNSYKELYSTVFVDYLKSKLNSNVLFMGSLSSISDSDDNTGILSWLDGQKPESVVYICFGTMVQLPEEEIIGLAEGLEACGIPFLWCIKDHYLPDGFLDRTKMIGKVVSWAPQSQVLKHPVIGVYLTHCGYNSTIESISGGVPMICRSGWADNHITAKIVEEVWKIGVRVEGRKITKNGIIKNLEMIFHHENGKKIRENVKTLTQVLVKASGPDGVGAQDLKTLAHLIISQE